MRAFSWLKNLFRRGRKPNQEDIDLIKAVEIAYAARRGGVYGFKATHGCWTIEHHNRKVFKDGRWEDAVEGQG